MKSTFKIVSVTGLDRRPIPLTQVTTQEQQSLHAAYPNLRSINSARARRDEAEVIDEELTPAIKLLLPPRFWKATAETAHTRISYCLSNTSETRIMPEKVDELMDWLRRVAPWVVLGLSPIPERTIVRNANDFVLAKAALKAALPHRSDMIDEFFRPQVNWTAMAVTDGLPMHLIEGNFMEPDPSARKLLFPEERGRKSRLRAKFLARWRRPRAA